MRSRLTESASFFLLILNLEKTHFFLHLFKGIEALISLVVDLPNETDIALPYNFKKFEIF
jgi:hypothetical protein